MKNKDPNVLNSVNVSTGLMVESVKKSKVSSLAKVVVLMEEIEGSLNRHQVEVLHDFENVPMMNVEKHKILRILVNLVHNAKHACDDSARLDKRLTVRLVNGEAESRYR
jgi:C4-dicarboxylate-specific signal transduction histidine kinase